MPTDPWLAIIGLGEDGPDGLNDASRKALAGAEVIFGAPRHLALIGADARGQAWPEPFALEPLLALRGRPVAALVSGDPFWHGAGGSLAAHLQPHEWRAFPVASSFSLAAARLGWRLEDVCCLGLHAAPFERLVPHLADKQRLICLVRDGAAPAALAQWLVDHQFGNSTLHVLERLGGPDERMSRCTAAGFDVSNVSAPVCVAVELHGANGFLLTPGRPDDEFAHDGQITRSAIRAVTLAALAPRAGQVLWDLGAGSGSISVEWCLAHQANRAHAVELKPERIVNIAANSRAFALEERLHIHSGSSPLMLTALPPADAVFVGGGLSEELLALLWANTSTGTRIVVNSVTLESDALLTQQAGRFGGGLCRFAMSSAEPLGNLRGWKAARPITQWIVVR
ncbi:precorrin-6y C5,15-methyltransferase (decarboxylating) subunit CbiE [Aureimonas fodinaquatilis]|uniref:Precorrin-6y C5,15-methyltransferase (Decarboxylating) subunit CbiE n=1 Tax=Aureimonas fodinaquatilis TaxID=2565783 RepID=A0A5B0DRW4_9HYPH|nr:precorrin-6y C5,15-methyltransferase (decarboxylating) subunit CbiE [Aureimonas fodinaquatilis]KAA0969544.1 precorrin-6y C5,15-methyltransferase (decarboxylating) subunit CbiE [Aureimonas fodinaquatilis]